MSWNSPADAAAKAGIKEPDRKTEEKTGEGTSQTPEKNADSAQADGKPYVIYFCSEQLSQTAGLGTAGLNAKIKSGVKLVKRTVFESLAVITAFKKAGFTEFFKVPGTKENIELAKKFNVTLDNTLVFCSPGGEKVAMFAGDGCKDSTLLAFLKTWPDTYAAWQKKSAK